MYVYGSCGRGVVVAIGAVVVEEVESVRVRREMFVRLVSELHFSARLGSALSCDRFIPHTNWSYARLRVLDAG